MANIDWSGRKRYTVIYADPPWPEKSESMIPNKARRASAPLLDARRSFSTMSPEDIRNLPVENLAQENAFLFLWSTARHLPAALSVIDAWGFRYVNMAFVWMKCNVRTRTPAFGLGYYTKQNAEFCLLGVRGSIKVVNFSINSAVYEPRTKTFRKPDTVRTRIEELCGRVPRIELFARERVKGWDAWGNQI